MTEKKVAKPVEAPEVIQVAKVCQTWDEFFQECEKPHGPPITNENREEFERLLQTQLASMEPFQPSEEP